jgi:hypothetical protein
MKYDIKCLGSFKGVGGIAWFYKFNIDAQEFLIIDLPQYPQYSSILEWTDENKFIDTKLSDEELAIIKQQYELVEKSNVVFDNFDDSQNYFTKHEKKEEDLKHYTGEEYSGDEINNILNIFDEFDFIYNNEGIIDQEMIDFEMEEYGSDSLQRLLNYKVDIETDGEHKNDGQMVGYTFTFTSPDNIVSEFTTEMCLMDGWNHYDKEIIK